MIPLLRPQMPSIDDTRSHFLASIEAGMFSNGGPCYEKASQLLSLHFSGHAIPVSNGTVAIQAAAHAYLDKNSTVAVPDFTCAATALAVLAAGHKIVVVPTNPDTLCIDLDFLDRHPVAFNAFVVVCPFGYKIDVLKYRSFAAQRGLKLIFDLAGAIGQDFGKPEEPHCYSFHATKNLGIGEGGAVVMPTPELAAKAFQYINFDFDNKSSISPRGINGKIDEWRCAMIISHLQSFEKIDARIKRKIAAIEAYQACLQGVVSRNFLHVDGAPSMCVMKTKLASSLEFAGHGAGITFRRYYYPLLSDMPAFAPFVLQRSRSDLGDYVAFPSDPTTDEFNAVIKFVRDCSQV